jgi:hypothetical protein
VDTPPGAARGGGLEEIIGVFLGLDGYQARPMKLRMAMTMTTAPTM